MSIVTHFINRDATERYLVMFDGDATTPIRIWNLDGTEKTVAYGTLDADNNLTVDDTVKEYVTATTVDVMPLTVAEHTIVVNREITPAMTGEITSGLDNPFGVVYVKNGVASTVYEVWVDGALEATYTSGSTSSPGTYQTSVIATDLGADLIANLGATWSVSVEGSSILISKLDGSDFSLKTHDSWGDSGLIGIKEHVSKIEDLPAKMPDLTGYYGTIINVVAAEHVCGYGVKIGDANWTLDGSGTGASAYILTGTPSGTREDICTHLYNDLVASLPGISANYRVRKSSPLTIHVWRVDNVAFDCVAQSRYQNSGVVFGGLIKTMTTPATASLILHVAKDLSSGSEGYYVKWTTETEDGRDATGVWKETVKPGLCNTVDNTTLPHRLVRLADGTFAFARIDWPERLAGDEDTAPNPSFIGQPIRDVFFHKNRLGFITASALVMSRTNDFWKFYPQTATEILDDDPIDVEVPDGSSELLWAVSVREDILLLARDRQFLVSAGDQIFSPKTIAVDSNISYPVSGLCPPIRCGANVYFISPKGANSSLMEYYIQAQTLTPDAADTCAHAPKYLPSGLTNLAGSAIYNLLLTCTGTDTSIYGYKYYWNGDQKAQSAWFKWTFDFYPAALTIVDNYVYILTHNGAGTYHLEKMNLDRANDAGLNFRIHLDHKTYLSDTHSYDADTNISTWDLTHLFVSEFLMGPFQLDNDSDWVLVDASTGKQIDGLHYTDDHHVHVLGDYRNWQVIIGEKYTQSYTFSEFGVPAPKGNVYSPQGRLQLRTLSVAYVDTAQFNLVVTPTGTTEGGRVAITHEYSGVEMGLATLGNVELTSARKRFLVWANAIGVTLQLQNRSFYPATWYNASWEGYYTTRNQGI